MIGFSKTDLIPTNDIELSGYGYYLGRKSTGILDFIWSKALYLKVADKGFLFISNDLLGLSASDTDDIANRISEKTGIEKVNIFIACTHTHSAPSVMVLTGCGKVSEVYLRMVKRKIVANAINAFQNKNDLESVSSTLVTLPKFVFDKTKDKTRLDQEALFLKFVSSKCTYLLANFACHPIVLNNSNTKVSADLVQAFYDLSKEYFCEEVIFFNGAAAEILPASILDNLNGVSTSDSYVSNSKYVKFIKETKNTLITKLKKNKWTPLALEKGMEVKIASIELNFEKPKNIKSALDLEEYYRKCFYDITPAIAKFIKSKVKNAYKSHLKSLPLDIRIVKFGDLLFVTIPSEITSKLLVKLRKSLKNVYIFSHTGGIVGYIPDSTDTGYPRQRGSLLYNNFPFEKQAVKKIYKKVYDLTKL